MKLTKFIKCAMNLEIILDLLKLAQLYRGMIS